MVGYAALAHPTAERKDCAGDAVRYSARLPLAGAGLMTWAGSDPVAPGATATRDKVAMPLYENVFIARQDISGAQAEALADGFAQLIADQGGEVKKRENWGLRNLAYRMNKNRKGHYVLFNIEAPAAAIAELERTMRINEDVVRYLTLRVDTLDEAPSAIMQNRGSREDRPRRSDRDRYGEGRDGGGERPAAETPAPAITPTEPAEKVEA